MASSNQKKNSGPDSSQFVFTLVAAAVAVLLLASPMANAISSARRAAASVNLGEIAKAYGAYMQANSATHMFPAQMGDTAHAAAVTLARAAQLNDGIIWFVKSDPALNGDSTPVSVTGGALDANSVNPDFANKTLSYVVAANISLNPPPPIPQPNASFTPIAWTRGLRDDGTWAPDSPWQGEGGHIAFMDGHVAWFNKLSIQPGTESLFKYGTNIPTTNILEALPPNAIVLNAEPGPSRP